MRLLALFLFLACCMPAWAATGDVPEAIQGRWADEGVACDAIGALLVVSATTLVYPDGTIDDVHFAPGNGADGAIRLREAGAAVGYTYVAASDTLVFHPQGFDKGSAFPMLRCQEPARTLERRCGWLANITPGDWWLVDGARTWILAERDGDRADSIPVMDMVPHFDAGQFVAIDLHHGYGCACLTVSTDTQQGRILHIASSRRLPLATCQADPSLPAVSDW